MKTFDDIIKENQILISDLALLICESMLKEIVPDEKDDWFVDDMKNRKGYNLCRKDVLTRAKLFMGKNKMKVR